MRHDALGYWIAEAGLATEPSRPPLRERIDADVAIAGGGYTGMWAAWWIKAAAPEWRVVLLEAGRCGFGPSGRNGGFVNALWFSLASLRARFGDGPALAVARAAGESVATIGRWCEEQGVDAWFRQGGCLQVSTAPAFDGAWDAAVRACRELDVAEMAVPLTPAEVAERCASPIFRAGALYPQAATVQPARLAAGLRARLLEAGVEIYEDSRVQAHRELAGGDHLLETDGGAVHAGCALLTAGASLLRFRPLRRALTATSSHMLITEPVPEVLAELGWSGGECVLDSRAMVHYFRTTPDGRIAFGWGGGRIVRGARLGGRAEVDPEMAVQVAARLRRFFPALRGKRIEHAWGGPIDVSPIHLPIVRSVGERAFAGFGFTGNGVGPTQMIGRALASLALGRRDEHSALAIVDPPHATVPPEPFRHLGGAVIREAIVRKEDAEEQGRAPAPLARLVSTIPERIGIHVGR